jgi:hypothetical protein
LHCQAADKCLLLSPPLLRRLLSSPLILIKVLLSRPVNGTKKAFLLTRGVKSVYTFFRRKKEKKNKK